jgi:hypothetical protein
MKIAAFCLTLLVTPALAAAPAGDPVPPGGTNLKHTMQDVTEFDIALSPLQVEAFYRKELAKRGWKPGDTVSYGTTLVLDARKSPKGAGRITIAPIGPGKTHVTVSFTE